MKARRCHHPSWQRQSSLTCDPVSNHAYNPKPRRYYRCSGTDRNRFHGQFRCDARLLALEPLEAAVWDEVCRLLRDPAHVVEEYRRRLDALSCGPRRYELDVMARQGDKLRHALGRLIDGYSEGLIAKHEFEPRIAEMRRRIARLDAEMATLRHLEEQTRSLQLVIGKLSVFAEMVHDRLETADWPLRHDIVRTLVKRIEVTDDVVRIVFRIEPGSSEPLTVLPHCQTGDRLVAHGHHRQGPARRRAAVSGLTSNKKSWTNTVSASGRARAAGR